MDFKKKFLWSFLYKTKKKPSATLLIKELTQEENKMNF